jgi:hypothetical protein
MSPHGTDLTEGMQELLDISGRVLLWGTVQFRGLFGDENPDNERYDLSPNDDDEVRITALREDFTDGLPTVGHTLTDNMNNHYRIKQIRRPPNHVVVRFHCQVIHP